MISAAANVMHFAVGNIMIALLAEKVTARELIMISALAIILATACTFGVIPILAGVMSADEQIVIALVQYAAAYLAIYFLFLLTFGVVAYAQISAAVSAM